VDQRGPAVRPAVPLIDVAATSTELPPPPGRPPLWRDVRVVRVALQVVVLVALVALLAYLFDNLRAQMRARGIETGFEFLSQPVGFPIPYSDLSPTDTVLQGFRVAAKNTALAAGVGIILCTILGLLVGVSRLSTNWLVRKAAALYVETLRNLPPVLIILFVNNAVLLQLPVIGEAIEVGGLLVISNRELAVAAPEAGDRLFTWLIVVGVALVAAGVVSRWRHRVHDRTGAPARAGIYAWLPFGVVVVGSYLALDGPVRLSHPEVTGLSVAGGARMNLPYAAVTLALALYTSSHVAEIVRGSILAVPRGQTEASTALGLSTYQRLRFVVLPQAYRIAIPPTINQYLNLTKNTSLGIFVAYTELTTFGFIAIGNGQPAPQTVAVVMAIYLAFSIVISVLMNLYNRRLRLVER
jgi:general L-amino acid transport system permease protein